MAKVERDRNLNATIKLTHDEANKLECYFLMTSEFRKNEIETWGELAERKDENGNPVFSHAESNANFWREMDEFINNLYNEMERWIHDESRYNKKMR